MGILDVMARAKPLVPLVLLGAAAASACGGSQNGTVQGHAFFEVGVTSRSLSDTMLQLLSGSAVVATQRVSPTGIYHFTVHPGTYSFSDLSHSPCPGTVTVRSGQAIRHDVICRPATAVG